MIDNIFRVARKEISAFFSSPVAFIFFGAFLAVTLFIFFWVETFFARNIADARPLFEWMPVLLIFLAAALTMRMWSDERRMGTLELLLTQPVDPLHFVLGKFTACMALVGIALLLTLPIPVTVSFLGNLDWGPVLGAYLATLFLAAAYIAIGLAISSKSDNQIVSLIATVLVCSFLYLLGSDALTSLLGNRGSEFFKLLGSGSRFASISRGVIDLRDLYYYLSIVGVFVSLNVLFLETIRWSKKEKNRRHAHWRLVSLLFIVNFIAGNIWFQQISWARADITEGRIYSISESTRGYLKQLREPLLIRGYFSAKTHPLLAPLVPQLRDLILEYEVAGNGKVRAEFIDPLENPELEEEAGQKYGIRPIPLQVSDKYQASLVNSYFYVLIKYGDQYETLGFRDLIEIKSRGENNLDVELRNPEYDITRSIKKVLYEFQSAGNIFSNIKDPVTFVGYISSDSKLPEVLVKFKKEVQSLLKELKQVSGDKLQFTIKDPDADNGKLAEEIGKKFGFRPMQMRLFATNTFYFYMTLSGNNQIVLVPLPEDFEKEGLRKGIEAALKRFSTGFLKTIAFYTPPLPPQNPFMRQFGLDGGGKQFQLLRKKIDENQTATTVDLKKGSVPDNADLLFLAAPDNLDDKQLFAIDQFLMKGGTVILSTSPFSITMTRGNLSAAKHDSGLGAWLEHNGITIEEKMVLDPQNTAFPIPVQRRLAGFTVQELRMVKYPYFVDIRNKGGKKENTLTSGISQVTLNWSSPISIDKEKNKDRKVTPLLESSPQSWTSDTTQIAPDIRFGNRMMEFSPTGKREKYILSVAVEGRFESFYKDKKSPLLKEEKTEKEKEKKEDEKKEEEENEEELFISSVIEKSPESARIILFASNEFLTDQTLNISSSVGGTTYQNSLLLAENAIDWSLEDRGLLAIRSRSHFSRTLYPLEKGDQMFWEYLNYGFALAGLMLVYAAYRLSRRKARIYYMELLEMGRA